MDRAAVTVHRMLLLGSRELSMLRIAFHACIAADLAFKFYALHTEYALCTLIAKQNRAFISFCQECLAD